MGNNWQLNDKYLYMNYDMIVNKLLTEAYFSSPYEKKTGIKRHMNFEGNSESEFKDKKNRIKNAQHLAVLQALEAWDEAGSPMGRTGGGFLVDKYMHFMLNDPETGILPGDELTDADHIRALLALGHASGVNGEELGAQLKQFLKMNIGPKAPGDEEIDNSKRFKPAMSLPGYSNLEKKAMGKLKQSFGDRKLAKEPDGIEDDPGKKAAAQARLRSSLDTKRARYSNSPGNR
jgi:hypothetical protein